MVEYIYCLYFPYCVFICNAILLCMIRFFLPLYRLKLIKMWFQHSTDSLYYGPTQCLCFPSFNYDENFIIIHFHL